MLRDVPIIILFFPLIMLQAILKICTDCDEECVDYAQDKYDKNHWKCFMESGSFE